MTALPKRKSAPQSNALKLQASLPMFGLQKGDELQIAPKDSYSRGEVIMMAPFGKSQLYVCAYLFQSDHRITLMIPSEQSLQLFTLPVSDITIIGSILNCQKLRIGLFA